MKKSKETIENDGSDDSNDFFLESDKENDKKIRKRTKQKHQGFLLL